MSRLKALLLKSSKAKPLFRPLKGIVPEYNVIVGDYFNQVLGVPYKISWW